MADIRKTGFLDDFHRPDEDPLSWDGRWGAIVREYGRDLNLKGYSVEVHTVTGGTFQASCWRTQAFHGDAECWGIGSGGSDLREGLALFLHITNPTCDTGVDSAYYSGYRAYYNLGLGGGILGIARVDAGSFTSLAEGGYFGTWGELNLLRKVGSSIECWRTPDSTGQTGWELQCAGTDDTYDWGYVGLGTANDDANPGWTGFGGGIITKSRIIRYVSN